MNAYPHMCRDGHPEIGHSTDSEMCPVCLEMGARHNVELALSTLQAEHARTVDELDRTKTLNSDLLLRFDKAREWLTIPDVEEK